MLARGRTVHLALSVLSNAEMERPRDPNETVGAALVTVVQAGQQLLADRIDLALLEGHKLLGSAAVDLALVLFGGLVLLGGLITVDVALVDQMRRSDSGSAPLLYCAALHGVIGMALLVAGMWRRRLEKAAR